MNGTTLVIGGTGKTGRRVADRLALRGVRVRIGSRSASPGFDWQAQDTWAPALRNATAAYVSFYPDLAVPGAAATIGAFAELAVASGVPRLVLLSGRGEPGAQLAEKALRDSGASWTILRASWFCQNFSEGAFRDQVLAGELALPAAKVREPFVDADDIAEAAVAALTEDGHVRQLYELTGPRLLTFAEATAEISRAVGRPIRFVALPIEEYASALLANDVPPDFVWLVRHLFTEVLDGRNSHLTDGVRRALGREPRDFRDYARAAAASGVWGRGVPEAAGRRVAGATGRT